MANKKEEFVMDSKTGAVLSRKGYEVGKIISQGAFGQVMTATKTSDGQMVAVKVMDIEGCSPKFKEKFLPRELSVLMVVKHKHVIEIHDMFRANNRIYIFMEFATNGTLSGALKANGALSEAKTRPWFLQILDALYTMHTKFGIAHRDLKLENVLLDKNNEIKLTDFGFAREAFDPVTGELTLSSTFCGTTPYYSPQILKKEPYDPFMSDVWALGVMFFALLNNRFPFHFKDLKVMLQEQITYGYKFKVELSRDAKDLTKKMLEPEVTKRISTLGIKEHPWCRKG